MADNETPTGLLGDIVRRCPSLSRLKAERGAHSALLHLRRRLPHDAEEQLMKELPGDFRSISGTPEVRADYRNADEEREAIGRSTMEKAMTSGATLEELTKDVENVDRAAFLARVEEEASLAGQEEAETVTKAAFATVAAHLPPSTSLHIRSMLPPGLAQLWIEGVEESSVLSEDQVSGAMGEFLAAMRQHFETEDEAQLHDVIRSGVGIFVHRLGAAEQKEILHYLPEEIRIELRHLEPVGHEEEASLDMDAEAYLNNVQAAAGLDSAAAAERAVLGVIRGIKVVARPRIPGLLGQLPESWVDLLQRA